MTAARLLTAARARAGMNQTELAKKAGLGVRTITAIEIGEIEKPNARTLGLLAKALGIQVEMLMPPLVKGATHDD